MKTLLGQFALVFCSGIFVASIVSSTSSLAQSTFFNHFDRPDQTDLAANAVAISPDGSLQAHLGPNPVSDGLFVKTLANGKDKQIVKDVDGRSYFNDISFSPDGSHILFLACPPLGADCGDSEIFTVQTDGSHLVKVGKSYSPEGSPDTSYELESPAYSPDGQRIFVGIMKVHDLPKTNDGEWVNTPPDLTPYVGVISANETEQRPEPLANGWPLTWSKDGESIFYQSENALTKFEISTKKVTLVKAPSGSFEVYGRVPGEDALFVRANQSGESQVTIVDLNGAEPENRLKNLAATIPLRDSNGLKLYSIKTLGTNQLSLEYQHAAGTPIDAPRHHINVVSF